MRNSPTSPRRFRWLFAVLAAAALHMLLFDRGLGGDGWAGFAVLTSLADDHDPWLENNHRGQWNGLVANREGHLVSQYPPGGPLLDALPFAAGRALDALLPKRLLAGGVELPPLGRVPRGLFLSAAAIVLARNAEALLGLLATALALDRLGCGRRATAAGVALAFFGGPLVFYSLVGMTHASAFALAALLFLLLVRCRERAPVAAVGAQPVAPNDAEKGRLAAPPAWAAGLTLGAAVLVRYDALALLLPALLALGLPAGTRSAARRATVPVARGRLRPLVRFALGLALPLLVLPFWWRLCFGSWMPPPYGGRLQLSWASPWNVLLSPLHGLIWFHPALALAVAGLIAGGIGGRRDSGNVSGRSGQPWSASGVWRWIALVWFLSVATLHGWWSEWANLGGYGQRFLCDALPPLALGFAWLAGRAARAPRAAALLLVSTGVATAFGYALFFAAVGGLVSPPAPYPWPLRLADYAPLLHHPPAPSALGGALCRASFTARLIVPVCRPER